MSAAQHLRLVPTPIGYWGAAVHSVACECKGCCWARASAILAKARKLRIKIHDARATVMVRSYTVKAHARRSKRHLSALPKTKAKLVELLRREVRS